METKSLEWQPVSLRGAAEIWPLGLSDLTAVLGGFKAERASPVLGRFAPEQP